MPSTTERGAQMRRMDVCDGGGGVSENRGGGGSDDDGDCDGSCSVSLLISLLLRGYLCDDGRVNEEEEDKEGWLR